MAKQIKGNEIIEDNHLANAILSAEKLKNVYKELDEQIIKTAKDAKANVSALAPNDAKSIIKINAELEKSIKLLEAKNDLEEKQKKVKTTLNDLSDKELKKRVQNQTELAKRKKLLKEELILENEQVGTLQKLAVANSKLRKERELLNLETKKGQDRLKQINSQLDKNNAKINSFSDNLKKRKINIGNYGSALNGATASLKRFAGALGITGGVYLLAQGIRDAFNVIKDFEQANANLASILGKTSDGISKLTQNAKELGAKTVFTAYEIIGLQTELGKLSFGEKEILASTEAIQSLASATGTDLAQSALQAGSTLKMFDLEAEEATRVVNVLALSTTKSALDMSKLATALPIVGSTAKTAGLSLERTTALLGVLSDRGIDASTSGTALRNIFLELSKQGLTYSEAMEKINNATDKNKVAMELFGKRGATAGIILAENAASANSLEEALLNSGGAAKKMADTQLDTLNGALALLKSAWEGLMLDFAEGNGIFGYLKDAIRFVAENLKTLVTVISVLTPAFIVLNAIMAANPIGAIIVGVVALTSYLISLTDEIKELSDKWEKVAKGEEDFNTTLQETIKFTFLYLTPLGILLRKLDEWLDITGYLFDETENLTEAERKNRKAISDKIDTQNRALKIGKELIDQNNVEINNSQILIDALMDENTTREERSKIIKKLNDDYPELIGNIDLETASTEQLIGVKRELVRQVLKQAVEERKAQALGVVTNKILDAQIKLLFAKNENQKQYLNQIIKENTLAIEKINDVANLVEENVNKVADNLDFSETFRNNSDSIDDYKNRVKELNIELNKAISSGDTERADVIKKQISDLNDRISELNKVREDTLNKILGTEKEITSEKIKQSKVNKENVKEDEKILENKRKLEEQQLKEEYDRKQRELNEYSDFLEAKEKLENEYLDSKLSKEDREINAVRDKYYKLIEMAKKYGEDTKILEQAQDEEIEAIKQAKDEDFHNKLNEDFTKIQESIKSLGETTTEVLTQLANVIENRLNDAIEKQNNLIAESQDRVNQLQEQAKMGNLDAQESIKAEKAQIAKDKLEIERLEKKKRNLQILVTGLNLANNYIQQGDNEGLTKATMQMGEFVNGLAGFYDGTDTTLGDSLGVAYSYKLNNDKDTHIIKAHKDEMIIGVDKMKQMPSGITQDEVVRRVASFEDGYFKNSTALFLSENKSNDNYILAMKLDRVENAIKSIEIPEHQFRYDELNKMAIETIKTKNKVITNRKNLGGTFS